MCIPNQNYLMDALETVLAWNLPDEALAIALVEQAKFLAGIDVESDWQLAEVQH